ncbi:MAG TPA: SDR family NAD(P)-dependent oxidoreductase [Terriglobales bacterium]|nr:SDR family NAD(P)-dependent oxidoreductase [Terriglobales bacterium]
MKRNGVAFVPRLSSGSHSKTVLITGGAGFIGTNVAHHLLSTGNAVIIFDNLSRPGTADNLRWLRDEHGARLEHVDADVRDAAVLRRAVARVSRIYHFAAQVAVTSSLIAPREDFEINAGGTLNLLEAIRTCDDPPVLLFTSTNKVYGRCEDLALERCGERYQACDEALRRNGVDETRGLDFCSPYGCSKGAADQYVLDYAHTFGLPATVFRMSCIYGPHQHGNEDQGWVAHFLRRALAGESVTIYGDGCQVRDILFADDLVRAMMLAHQHIERCAGQAFNIGGGPANTISLLELLHQIRDLTGVRMEIELRPWRAADQRFYVSDAGKFRATTGWQPQIGIRQGIARLWAWLQTQTGSASLDAALPRAVAASGPAL